MHVATLKPASLLRRLLRAVRAYPSRHAITLCDEREQCLLAQRDYLYRELRHVRAKRAAAENRLIRELHRD